MGKNVLDSECEKKLDLLQNNGKPERKPCHVPQSTDPQKEVLGVFLLVIH